MLFSTDDYPAEAIGRSEQGTVAVVLRISSEGRVSDCLIEGSSGSSALDHQTCRILWARAQFKPARDQKGNAVESAFRQRIRWILPDPEPADFADLFARHVLTLNGNRDVVSCRYEASPPWDRPGTGCVKVIEDMRPFLALPYEQIPLADRELVAEIKYSIGHPAGGQELGERRGEYLVVLSRLLLTIDTEGGVKNCSQESWGIVKAKPNFFDCEVARRWRFEALPDDEANRNDRQLTMVRAIYLRAQGQAPSVPSPATTIDPGNSPKLQASQ